MLISVLYCCGVVPQHHNVVCYKAKSDHMKWPTNKSVQFFSQYSKVPKQMQVFPDQKLVSHKCHIFIELFHFPGFALTSNICSEVITNSGSEELLIVSCG